MDLPDTARDLSKAGILMAAVAAGALALGMASLHPLKPSAAPAVRRADRFRQPVREGASGARPGARQAARSRSRISPAPPPAVTPDGELIPDAALPDPELERAAARRSPNFDVTTPPPGTDVGDDDEKVEPVRYTLVVEGLDEIGLEGRFRDLSALEDADGEATNGAQISARAKEDELLAVRLLRSEGYYDATALVLDRAVARAARPDAGHGDRRSRPALLLRQDRHRRAADRAARPRPRGAAAQGRRSDRRRSASRRPRPMSGSACRSKAIRSPRSAFATSCSIPTPGTAITRCRSSPGPRALRRLHHRRRPRLRRQACRRAFALQARRALRQPQGRRSARGDDRDQLVHHRLGRAGRDRREGRGRHRICEHPRHARTRARRARSPAAPATAPARASAPRRPGSIATSSRPKGALRLTAVAGTQEQLLRVTLRRNELRSKRDRSHLRPGRGGPARSRPPSRAIPPGCSGSGLPRIDADLAEGLDLRRWRRADRDQRGPDRDSRVSRSATPSSSPA